MVHAVTDADNVRPPVRLVNEAFFLRASYGREIDRIVSHLATLGIDNFGFLPIVREYREGAARRDATAGVFGPVIVKPDRSVVVEPREARQCTREREEVLLQLLRHSIERGHRRLVMRRVLMLEVCGLRVPDALKPYCDRVFEQARAGEVVTIRRAVLDLAAMVNGAAPPSAAWQRTGAPTAHLTLVWNSFRPSTRLRTRAAAAPPSPSVARAIENA